MWQPTKQAEKEEAAAQLANIQSYKLWIVGGAADGLKRQRQFTRNATGWTDTALGKGNHNEVGEQDDLDGLSEEQIEAIRTKVGDTTSPVDVQTEVNDQAAAWKKCGEVTSQTRATRRGPMTWALSPQGSSSRHYLLLLTPSLWKRDLVGTGFIRGL